MNINNKIRVFGRRMAMGIALLSLLTVLPQTAFANTELWRSNLDSQVRGYRQSGACMTFAASMGRQLLRDGVPVRILYYTWRDGTRMGNHAVVVYRHQGKWYGGDQYVSSPQVLSTGSRPSPQALAKRFSRGRVVNARFVTNFP